MQERKHPSSSRTRLKLEVFDCPSRFLVWSESRPDECHLVDLDENEGRGECSCEDWNFNQGDYYLWQKPYECKHIKTCRLYQAQEDI